MAEIIKTIKEFPNYEITSHGRVFNRITGKEMVLSLNTTGDPTVGMVLDGTQYRRSVKNLVGVMFVPGRNEIFDTTVQLDGNKLNLHMSNIVWRPRWFAWLYTNQFNKPQAWHHYGPIVDLLSGEEWETFLHASIANGVLCRDIRRSIYNEIAVFPTGQLFGYA